jgi:hypothetical protein
MKYSAHHGHSADSPYGDPFNHNTMIGIIIEDPSIRQRMFCGTTDYVSYRNRRKKLWPTSTWAGA